MRFQARNRHVIDLIFPIALFFVFAVSALSILILAADTYASTTGQLRINDENRTALSYITEKIRQNDTRGAVYVSSIDGIDCLAMSYDYNEVPCTTYIYEYKGMLKELFINDGVTVSLENGRNIMELAALSIEQPEEHLFRLTATDSKGNKSSLIASERSVP